MSVLRDNILGSLKVSLFVLLTLLFFIPQFIIKRFLPRFSLILPQYFHQITLKILNVKVVMKGEVSQSLLISNHLSWLDIVVLGSLSPLRFVAKNDVESWFIFGSLAKLQQTIFVDRHSRTEIIASKEKIEAAILKSPIVLFAEGTTSDGTCVLPMNSSFVITPAQAVTISYDKPNEIAWYGDMELLPHLWHVFKQPRLNVEVEFLDVYREGNRKLVTQSAENLIRNAYEGKLSLS